MELAISRGSRVSKCPRLYWIVSETRHAAYANFRLRHGENRCDVTHRRTLQKLIDQRDLSETSDVAEVPCRHLPRDAELLLPIR